MFLRSIAFVGVVALLGAAPYAQAQTFSYAGTKSTGISAAQIAAGDITLSDADLELGTGIAVSDLRAALGPTAPESLAQAQTLQGINRVLVSNNTAVISEEDRATGIGGPFAMAVSIWADSFTITGGTGTGTVSLSAGVTGQFGNGYGAEGLYALAAVSQAEAGQILADPIGAALGDSLPSPILQVHQSTTAPQYIADGERVAPGSAFGRTVIGTYEFTYDQPFVLVSMLAGFAHDFGSLSAMQSAVFGLTVTGNAAAVIETGSGAVYPLAAVPEPETYALFLAGLGLLGVAARRARA
jgi:hypothetical protein